MYTKSSDSIPPSSPPSAKIIPRMTTNPNDTSNLGSNKRVTIPQSGKMSASSNQSNMSLPSLSNPPSMMNIAYNQVNPGTPHPHLYAVQNCISNEITSSIDNYLDMVLSAQLRSTISISATLASSNSNPSESKVDPILLQQSMQCTRAMILNCRTTLVPWLKAQLNDQCNHLVEINEGVKGKYYNYTSVMEDTSNSNSSNNNNSNNNNNNNGRNSSNNDNSSSSNRNEKKEAPVKTFLRRKSVLDATSSRGSANSANRRSSGVIAQHSSIDPVPANSTTDNTINLYIRNLERLIKINENETIQSYLAALEATFDKVFSGAISERPDLLDVNTFSALKSQYVNGEILMKQIFSHYGAAGTTLMHSACALKRGVILNTLNSFGADSSQRNARGLSIAQLAIESGDTELCKAVKECGCCISTEELRDIETKSGRPVDGRLVALLIGVAPPPYVSNNVNNTHSSQTTLLPPQQPVSQQQQQSSPQQQQQQQQQASPQQPSQAQTSTPAQSAAEPEKPSTANGGRRNSIPVVAGATILNDPKMAEYAKTVLSQIPSTVPPNSNEKLISRWLERLVKYGQKKDITTFFDSMTPQDRQQYTGAYGHSKSTILFLAAWSRRIDLFEFMIDDLKVDPTQRNVRKQSALINCIEQNDFDGVQLLLEYGCGVSEKDVRDVEQRTGRNVDQRIVDRVKEYCTLQKIASVFEKGEVSVKEKKATPQVDAIKKREQQKAQNESWRVENHKELERVVKFGDVAKAREMLEEMNAMQRELILSPTGQSKSSLLFTAAWNKRAEMCKVLVEYKSDVNYRNLRRNSAINMAVEQNDLACVVALLEAGADFSGAECREIEKRKNKPVDERIIEAVFEFCNK